MLAEGVEHLVGDRSPAVDGHRCVGALHRECGRSGSHCLHHGVVGGITEPFGVTLGADDGCAVGCDVLDDGIVGPVGNEDIEWLFDGSRDHGGRERRIAAAGDRKPIWVGVGEGEMERNPEEVPTLV